MNLYFHVRCCAQFAVVFYTNISKLRVLVCGHSNAHASDQLDLFRMFLLPNLHYRYLNQIIQYINLIKSDDTAGSHGDYFSTSLGQQFSWLPADQFEFDDPAGHGTHTAGSVAGATLNNPAVPITCDDTETLSCVGACIDDNPTVADDDLVSYFMQYADIDRLCPLFSDFGCDGTESQACLSDDVSENLTNNGGMAQGAKLAIFDAFYGALGLADFVGNGLWEPCREADCKLHSNSWGGDYQCQLGPQDVLYDTYMYQVSPDIAVCCLSNVRSVGADGHNARC